MKRLRNKTQFGHCILYAGLFIFPILLSACGSGSGTSGVTSSDTGSIAMSVEFLGAPSESKLNKIEVNQTAQLECGAESGVFWVKAHVYDEYDLYIAGGGDWPCEVHSGTITGVPAGTDRKVVILGKGEEPDKVIVYRGERRDITVTAGLTTNAGTIECIPFIPTLMAPASGSIVGVSLSFEWDPVIGASEYRIVVSEDSNLIDPILDATTTNTTFTPSAAFSDATTYYWQVRAHDRYGNVGGGSEIWSFVVSVSPYPNTVVGEPIPVGNFPYGLAVTPKGSYVYVANRDDNTVSVIDTYYNTVVGYPIPVGVQPIVVAVTPDGGYVYVVNEADAPPPTVRGTVSVIRTSDNTVVDTIDVDYLPHGVAVTPDGSYVYVVNSWGDYGTYGTVSVIRTSDNTVVYTIYVDYYPYGIAVTPDGSYAYVAHYGNDTVSAIRTSDNTVVGDPIPVGKGPVRVAVTPDGSYVYVANYDDEPTGTVSVIETSTNSVIDIDPTKTGIQGIDVGLAPYGIEVTPDGSYVYVANSKDKTVSVIQTLGNTVVEDILLGMEPGMVALTPNGRYVYVTHNGDNMVSVIGFQVP